MKEIKSTTLLKCKICGRELSVLTTHIIRKHNLTTTEYLKQFQGAELTTREYRQKMSLLSKSKFVQNPKLRKMVASRTFDFITNERLKQLLSRDFKTAKVCMKNKLWKPSIILYGSLIEAILREITYIESFYEALDKALSEKQISETEYHQIHVVRNSRNFVHLHKELEDKAKIINDYWAKTLSDICESLISRLRIKKNV